MIQNKNEIENIIHRKSNFLRIFPNNYSNYNNCMHAFVFQFVSKYNLIIL